MANSAYSILTLDFAEDIKGITPAYEREVCLNECGGESVTI